MIPVGGFTESILRSWMPMMADATEGTVAIATVLGWVTSFVVAVIGVLLRHQAIKKGRDEGKQEAQLIGPQPFLVKMEERFVTKEEFKDFRNEVRVDVVDMKGLFARAVDKIEERDEKLSKRIDDRDERLSAKIESVAKSAYEARGRIHQKVNDHGERLRSLEDRTPKATK